jgi:cell division protein ZapE
MLQVFFVQGQDPRDRWEELCFRRLGLAAKENNGHAQPQHVQIRQGRSMLVEHAFEGVCMFHFDELCSADVGAADFAALAATFHTVVIDELPGLSTASHNEAQRFVTLIDEL